MTLRHVTPLLLLGLLGCASEPPAPPEPPPKEVSEEPREQPTEAPPPADDPAPVESAGGDLADPVARAHAQEARRVSDPEAWPAELVQHADPVVRAQAARAIGRVGDPRLVAALLLPADADETVERERLFALGQIGSAKAADHLVARLTDERAGVRALAVEALAKLGEPGRTASLLGLLEDPDAAVRGQCALALVRLRGRRVKPPAPFDADEGNRAHAKLRRLLDDDDTDVVWRATYALANLALPRRLPTLEVALHSDDERVRVFALRGIGQLKDATPRRMDTVSHALQEAMKAGQVHTATTAVQVLGSFEDAGAIPYLAWAAEERPESDSRLEVRAHHLRTASLSALSKLVVGLAQDNKLDRHGRMVSIFAMRKCLDATSVSVRSAALVGLAQLDPRKAGGAIRAKAKADDPHDRMAAASAAAFLPREAVVELFGQLSKDADARVVCAALEGLGGFEGEGLPVREAALKALAHADMAVRTTGLTLLQEHGKVEDAAVIVATLAQAPGDANAEVRMEGVKALAALGKQDADAATGHLRDALRDDSAAIRKTAADGLRELTGKPVQLPDRGPEKPPSVALGTADRLPGRPRIALHTSKGKLVIELFREDAPHHVKSILERARAGKHDGLIFHRVVSAFVIQGLDPRGDGFGTGDVFLRDEINQQPYLRGALGMPNAGPDSGGCQIFVTHIPTPHLDGRYTVFGQVVEGFDVLDAIELGDVCERAEVLE